MGNRLQPNRVANVAIWSLLNGLVSAGITTVVLRHVEFDNLALSWLSKTGEVLLDFIDFPFVMELDWQNTTIGMFAGIYLVMLLLQMCFILAMKKPSLDFQHVTGIHLLTGKQVKTHASRYLKKTKHKALLFLHPLVPMTNKMLTGNIFVFGMQGSGKSTIIKSLLIQLSSTPYRLFVFDLKHEYEGYTDPECNLILKIGEKDGACWDICSDIADESDAASVSIALIEDDDESNRFFTEAAREVTKGVLIALLKQNKSWSWDDLANRIFATREQLHTMLAKVYPPAAVLIEDDNKTTQSIRSVISTRLSWLYSIAEYANNADTAFSVKQWLQNDDTQRRQVVFKPNAREVMMSRAVCNAITALISSNLLSMPDQDENQTWLILDELGHLPKSKTLEIFLTLSRSKGGRTIAGTQSLSQLNSVYGDKASSTLLSLFRTNIVLGLGAAGGSAQQASEAMGNHRVITIQRSKSEVGNVSLTEQFADRPVISAEDITNIAEPDKYGVTGYAVIGGCKAIYKLKWPYPSAKAIR
jgi:hypothetical protein